jgi:hypothetical protein
MAINPAKAQEATATPVELSPVDSIHLPDLFVSFLSQEPDPHSSLEAVRREGEEWFAKYNERFT